MSVQSSSTDEFWVAQVESHLRRERYCQQITKRYLAVIRRFLGYIRKRNIEIERVCPSSVHSYLRRELRIYRQRHCRSPKNKRQWRNSYTGALHLLLRLVQGQWPPEPHALSKRESFNLQVCKDYSRWLSEVRGLALRTVSDRYARALQFLDWFDEHNDNQTLRDLTVTDIDAYFSMRGAFICRYTCKQLATCLRCFLRFLNQRGLLSVDLAPMVLSPKIYAFEGIPCALRDEDVVVILESAQQDSTPKGLRDYAILLLLSTYGLRAGEVVMLRLEDIDWRHETIRVRCSKSGRELILPLLIPVGEAILRYLKHGRPQTDSREIFIRAKAPYRPFRDGSSLYGLISRRFQRAGIQTHGKRGPHILRHTQACRLLRSSVPLKTIGDILGHRSTSSTAVYLKLATEDLRNVGLDVPGEVIV